ncbi:hypothetical protein JTE90_007969 [Oedothorax gibbosus]|uniref:Recombination activating protein 1 n=1 Tax=Oedothorax gibbosus TaxID=931172 RepID=A0AAV6UP80_9ARAC|nr:hypothetical protein JTE90_007969 [Oedothorax gibbosus]
MDKISSRYRKPKGRPKKSRTVKSENAKKRWAAVRSPETLLDCSNETNLVSKDNDYIIMCKSLWSKLLQNIPCPDCQEMSLKVSQTLSLGCATKIGLICEACMILVQCLPASVKKIARPFKLIIKL